MKLLIEVPTWLGDCVMATPAIENIAETYPECELVLFGSFLSTRLFLEHSNVDKVIVDKSRSKGNRYLNLYKYAGEIGKVDIALSFRSNFGTKFLFWFLDASQKCIYRKGKSIERHQVLRYNDFINSCLGLQTTPGTLKIYQKQIPFEKSDRKTVGINPGATYGSAKRWYPEKFAKVAISLSDRYDIVIFGGPGEKDIAADIEKELQKFSEAMVDEQIDSLVKKERWLVINKIDLLAEEERQEKCAEIVEQLDWQGPVFYMSAINKEGTKELCFAIMDHLEAQEGFKGHSEEADIEQDYEQITSGSYDVVSGKIIK